MPRPWHCRAVAAGNTLRGQARRREPVAEPDVRTPSPSGAAFEQHRDLHDAREQLGASREILVALGRAGANPGDDPRHRRRARRPPVRRRCRPALPPRRGRVPAVPRLRRARRRSTRGYLREHPVALNRLSSVGRAALDRRTLQIPDVLTDAEYGRQDLQRLGGYRTLLSAPMILDDEVVGVLVDVAHRRRALRRPGARAARGVRRPGRDRAAAGRPDARPGVARRRAGEQGGPARGAARGRRGGELEPGPRRGAATRSSPTPCG